MKVKITVPKAGASNELGTATRLYEKDEVVDASEPWQKEIMERFVENGWAMEIKVVEPKETITAEAEVVASEKEAPKPKAKKKAATKAKAKAKSE